MRSRHELSTYLSWSPFAKPAALQIKQDKILAPYIHTGFNPENLHLPAPFNNRPLLSPVLNRWLKQMQDPQWVTRSFRQRSAKGNNPAGQSLQGVADSLATYLDIAPFEVHFGGAESLIYAEMGPEQRMVVSPVVAELSKGQARFILLRALYAHYQRHNQAWALCQNMNADLRQKILNNFYHWNQRNAKPILSSDWQPEQPNLARLSHWLTQLCSKYRSSALSDLRELLLKSQPFKLEFEVAQTRFALCSESSEAIRSLIPKLVNPGDLNEHLTNLTD